MSALAKAAMRFLEVATPNYAPKLDKVFDVEAEYAHLKRLIAQVENEQRGAFASFFDQPLLKAVLVPLGGAGGTQLFDYLLLGR